MRTLPAILFGLLLCGAFGYSLNRSVLSAEAAVRRELSNVCPHGTVPRDFHVLGSRKWSNKLSVVYKVNCGYKDTPSDTGNLLGHQVLVRKGIGWQAVDGDRIGLLPQVPPGEIVQYGTTRKQKQGDRPTVVYGEILTPKVAAVEATFDNGKTLRDDGQDGMFAMALPEAAGVREVRVLGADGQVLQRDNDSSDRQPRVYFDGYADRFTLTLEDAVRADRTDCTVPNDPEAKILGDYRILRTVKLSLGTFVLYRVICRDGTTAIRQATLYTSLVIHRSLVNHRITERLIPPEDAIFYKKENKRSVWQQSLISHSADYLGLDESSDSFISFNSNPPSSFVTYSLIGSNIPGRNNPGPAYAHISGRALTSKVADVEATLSTGQVLRDRVTNGVFFILLLRPARFCELRILGVNGQVLQRINEVDFDESKSKSCPNLG